MKTVCTVRTLKQQRFDKIVEERNQFLSTLLVEAEILPTTKDKVRPYSRIATNPKIVELLDTYTETDPRRVVMYFKGGIYFDQKVGNRVAPRVVHRLMVGAKRRTAVRLALAATHDVHLQLGDGLKGIRQADVRTLRPTNEWELHVIETTAAHSAERKIEADRMLTARKLDGLPGINLRQYQRLLKQ